LIWRPHARAQPAPRGAGAAGGLGRARRPLADLFRNGAAAGRRAPGHHPARAGAGRPQQNAPRGERRTQQCRQPGQPRRGRRCRAGPTRVAAGLQPGRVRRCDPAVCGFDRPLRRCPRQHGGARGDPRPAAGREGQGERREGGRAAQRGRGRGRRSSDWRDARRRSRRSRRRQEGSDRRHADPAHQAQDHVQDCGRSR